MNLAAITYDHSRLSSTAALAAYARARTDIPYAFAIGQAVRAHETTSAVLGSILPRMAGIAAPLFEARYRSVTAGLKARNAGNILELAMGFSPRGLEHAGCGGVYVGTDLAEALPESARVLRTIASQNNISPDHLHFRAVNVLDACQLEEAVAQFGKEQFTVCAEGLLLHFSREEQACAAENLRSVLAGRGSFITPDIDSVESFDRTMHCFGYVLGSLCTGIMTRIAGHTGRQMSDSYFPTDAAAQQFFTDAGYLVQTVPWYDGAVEMRSLARLPHMLQSRVEAALKTKKTWIVTPKHHS